MAELRADVAALSQQLDALHEELRTMAQAQEAQAQALTALREREGHRYWALAHFSFNGCVAAWRAVPMLNLSYAQAAANCRSDLETPVPHLDYATP
jgi:hypothetical protein